MIKEQNIINSTLLRLTAPSQLPFILGISDEQIFKLISNRNYVEFNIPKKNGGKRKIQSPCIELMNTQKILAKSLQDIYSYQSHPSVHGYIKYISKDQKSNSIITNAKNHVGKKFVLNIDINDFFGSITSKRVKEMFQSTPFNFPDQLAAALTLFCTFKGKLPQGAPSSPVITNFVFYNLDCQIADFCNEFNVTYTRYADDMTFSTNEPAFGITALTTFRNQIEILISKENFKLNEDKIILRTDKQKQIVTGIKVNKKLNVENSYKKRVRAMLHDYKVNGLEKAAEKYFKKWRPNEKVDTIKFLEILKGKISFMDNVMNANTNNKG